jgi:Tfp pilus assembly protein PilV
MSEPNRSEYDRFLDQRRHLEQQRRKSNYEFDRQVLLLSAGALALSITFLHDIAPCPKAGTVLLLGIGWLGLVTAIVATVLSFRESSEAFLQQIRESDELYRTKKSPTVNDAAARRTRRLTTYAAVGFAVGLSCLALFAVLNADFSTGGNHGQDTAGTKHAATSASPEAPATTAAKTDSQTAGHSEAVSGKQTR